MKDYASSWVGRGTHFFYSLEGHLDVLLWQQGACLQKTAVTVLNPTAARGIVTGTLRPAQCVSDAHTKGQVVAKGPESRAAYVA